MTVSLYAALLCFWYIALTFYVVRGRMANKVAIGDGGSEDMRRRIRVHANFAEYAPLFLLLLSLAEYGGLAAWRVHVLGAVFIAGRLMHAYALAFAEVRGRNGLRFRQAGMVCTLACLAGVALALLAQFAATH